MELKHLLFPEPQTQGTADIILDSCDDFWSGKDLRPLKEDERKRAQDFYQRNALVRTESLPELTWK